MTGEYEFVQEVRTGQTVAPQEIRYTPYFGRRDSPETEGGKLCANHCNPRMIHSDDSGIILLVYLQSAGEAV